MRFLNGISGAGKWGLFTCGTDFSEYFIECLQVYGTGTITLSLHCKMEEGQVWFDGCVEDTGVGMTKEKLAQVFAEYVSFSEDMG